jgi:hypothetical protein
MRVQILYPEKNTSFGFYILGYIAIIISFYSPSPLLNQLISWFDSPEAKTMVYTTLDEENALKAMQNTHKMLCKANGSPEKTWRQCCTKEIQKANTFGLTTIKNPQTIKQWY